MKMQDKPIPFSPPDIGQAEIDSVVETLKSGWITTGPKTKQFEKDIAAYCGTEKAVCLNSATAGLELCLRLLDVGPGDEVITTPYTFAATANVILHTGAKPVFADVRKGSFNIDPDEIARRITTRTKAVIPVDIGGWPCDYDDIKTVLEQQQKKYHPRKKTLQEQFSQPVIIADAAHSFGAGYKNKKAGNLADFTVFSFHAVKNLTTAEGGAVTYNALNGVSSDELYQRLQLFSLHGQSKDAHSKMKAGAWQYTIEIPGYKFNMTDIMASIGIEQLKRMDSELIPKRKLLYQSYCETLKNDARFLQPPFSDTEKEHPFHLYMLRIEGADEQRRAQIISNMAQEGVAANVHFIPVVMQPAYQKLGYSIRNYPNTFEMYRNEISLPLYSKLSENDVYRVCEVLKRYA